MTPHLEGFMLDLLQLTSVLLASLGLILWLWSAHALVPLKRPLRRAAIFAAIVSALLQAGLPAPRTQLRHIQLWASLVPPAGLASV
jgi:hypothetical protein